MVANEGVERRKYVRGQLPYKTFVYVNKDHIVSAYTVNISEGGLRVVLGEKMKEGIIVSLEIYRTDDPTLCRGRIVWVKETEDPEIKGETVFDTGIEFCEDGS